jgi:serpin B
MNGEGKGRKGDDWKSAVLPYAGGQLAMTVVLPDPGRFDDVTQRMSSDGVGLFDGGEPLEIDDLSLPRFDFGSSMSLVDSLAHLGMPTAFTERADFSAVTRQTALELSHVLHQANITVDEKGTVAAAATAAVARATSAPAHYERLVFDRPFLFLVRDVPTGATLFAGQVTNPSKKG